MDAATPVIVFHPAMGVGWSYYRPLIDRLRRLGVIVVAADLRGHDVRGRHSDSGFREIVEVDIPAIVAETRSRWPGHPIWLMGHSLGGQLSAVSAAHAALPISGLVLVAAGSAHFRAFPSWRGIRNRLLAPCFAALTVVLGYWPGDRVGFGGRQPRRLLLDWAHLVRTGRYRSGETGREYDDDLRRAEQRVLLVGVVGDTLAPEGAIDELRRKMPRSRVTAVVRPAPPVGKDPHFSWVRGDEGLARDVVEWIRGDGPPHASSGIGDSPHGPSG
ncbi:alpha/beta hydrolase family protein [Leifsonia shinshuensis]|uniref:Alpha/beta fold hydrolase n=1 Tax=Leifsonia shinshuensis TaxID=150026 RepID=A0A7G6YG12_9MICO|nr:alpha/beta fold hydrolase [Leifsonia shinshuensis]QNE37427.1 alpha/beta fold hydrolase [Leifsonia shinshuensis]